MGKQVLQAQGFLEQPHRCGKGVHGWRGEGFDRSIQDIPPAKELHTELHINVMPKLTSVVRYRVVRRCADLGEAINNPFWCLSCGGSSVALYSFCCGTISSAEFRCNKHSFSQNFGVQQKGAAWCRRPVSASATTACLRPHR